MAASTAAANTTFFMALAFEKFFLLVLCFRQKQGRKTVPEHDIFVGFVFIMLIYSLLVWRCGGREACLGLGRFVERCGGIPRFAERKSAESLAIACKSACRRRLFRLQDLAAFAVGDYEQLVAETELAATVRNEKGAVALDRDDQFVVGKRKVHQPVARG